jgi:hypothetical protein
MSDAMTYGSTADEQPFRLKLLPLLFTVALGYGIPYIAGKLTRLMLGYYVSTLPLLYVHHALQLGLALIAIAILKRFIQADFGLHWPRQRTYLLPALGWGVLFGVLMLLVDYTPQLLTGTAPKLDYPLTTGNVVGWLAFEGLYVGPTEEIPFRALLVTYLAATMPGRLRVGRFSMNWAGVIVALIFALLHANNFWHQPWPRALGQQMYAFALGVLYAYWLEKSRSVVASCVGHNVSDVVEYVLLFAWVALAG